MTTWLQPVQHIIAIPRLCNGPVVISYNQHHAAVKGLGGQPRGLSYSRVVEWGHPECIRTSTLAIIHVYARNNGREGSQCGGGCEAKG